MQIFATVSERAPRDERLQASHSRRSHPLHFEQQKKKLDVCAEQTHERLDCIDGRVRRSCTTTSTFTILITEPPEATAKAEMMEPSSGMANDREAREEQAKVVLRSCRHVERLLRALSQ